MPSAGLRRCVRAALGMLDVQALTPGDLKQLTSLVCEDSYVDDLAGLQFATNLTELSLARNWIRSTTPLRELTTLTRLDLSDNQLSAVGPLWKLNRLAWLKLDHNALGDLEPLPDAIPALSARDQVLPPLFVRWPDTITPQAWDQAGRSVAWAVPSKVKKVSGRLRVPNWKATYLLRFTGANGSFTGTVVLDAHPEIDNVLPGKVTISDTTPKVGQRLTAKVSGWSSAGWKIWYRYQWYRNGRAIPGATSATYTVVAADYLARLKVRVTGENDAPLEAAKSSKQTAKTKRGTFGSKPAPKLVGMARPGQTMTVNAGRWSPAASGLRCRWQNNGKYLRNASSCSYHVRVSDVGDRLRVEITASRPGYVSVKRKSSSVRVTAPAAPNGQG